MEHTGLVLIDMPAILKQYVKILSVCTIESFLLHAAIRWTIHYVYGSRYALIQYNYISTALILSSFAKLLLLLMIIWDYTPYANLVELFVFTSNVEAVAVFLDGYRRAIAVMSVGMGVKWLFALISSRFI
jgi:hypothetical protein